MKKALDTGAHSIADTDCEAKARHAVRRGWIQHGEIGARTGLTPDTLRYYERLGLLPRFRRTTGGFRIYTSEVVERVRFIKQAQTIGLSLEEIRDLVRHLDGHREQRTDMRNVVTMKLAQIDAKLRELRAFQRTLMGCLERASVDSA